MIFPRYDAIPVRATIWSAFTLIPYLGIGFTVSLHASFFKATAAAIIGSIALTLNAMRFPITLMVTFASNKQVGGRTFSIFLKFSQFFNFSRIYPKKSKKKSNFF
jgi:hypothetical protein